MIKTTEKDNKFIKSLIDNAKAGNFSSLETLYDFNAGNIYLLCYRLTGNSKTALDYTKKIFLSAWEHIKYIPEDASFVVWLNEISISVIVENYKPVFEKSTYFKPKYKYDAKIDERIVSLPVKERFIFVLRFICNYSIDEIKDLMQLSQDEIKALLNSAIELLIDYNECCNFLLNSFYDKYIDNLDLENTEIISHLETCVFCNAYLHAIDLLKEELGNIAFSNLAPQVIKHSIHDIVDEIKLNEEEIIKFEEEVRIKQEENDKKVAQKIKAAVEHFESEEELKKEEKRKTRNFTTEIESHPDFTKVIGLYLKKYSKIIIATVIVIFALFLFNYIYSATSSLEWQLINSKGSVLINNKPLSGSSVFVNDNELIVKKGSYAEIIISESTKLSLDENTSVKRISNNIYFNSGKIELKKNNSEKAIIEIPEGSILTKDKCDLFVEGDGQKTKITLNYGAAELSNNLYTIKLNHDFIVFGLSKNFLLPVYQYSTDNFKNLISNYDHSKLDAVLYAANTFDALTLLYLIPYYDDNVKSKIYIKLFNLIPPPSGVDQNTIVKLDKQAFEAYAEKIIKTKYGE